ncbi:MAG: competence/damage-inducible protein A [Bacteroidota bacterium]
MLQAEVITIGDEILIGQVTDSNSTWIAKELDAAGIPIHRMITIADDPQELVTALDDSLSRADIIIMTGGLGPTSDDHTKPTLCKYFNSHLVFHEDTFKDIEHLFPSRGLPITAINRKQAEIPECCTPIRNQQGTAPGMWFEKNNRIVISLPGVPFEMKAMMKDSVIPALLKNFIIPARYHKTILTQGVGESFLAEKIQVWEENLPRGMQLAYLPSPGLVRLRLTAVGNDQDETKEKVDKEIRKLYAIIPELIFGEGDQTLEAILGELLRSNKKTLAIAESCSGGYIAHRITMVPGSSEYFAGSITAYSNEVKIRELSVDEAVIVKCGAVSEEVACAMAEGIRKKFKVEYAIATTGIAGPAGGSDQKPVGTTWIAVSSAQKTTATRFLFGEHRERNIIRTTLTAMNMLRKRIIEENQNR